MERIPILKMGRFLLVSIQVDMHDRLALALQDDLTARITATLADAISLALRQTGFAITRAAPRA